MTTTETPEPSPRPRCECGCGCPNYLSPRRLVCRACENGCHRLRSGVRGPVVVQWREGWSEVVQ